MPAYFSPISVIQQRALYFHSLIVTNYSDINNDEINYLLKSHPELITTLDTDNFTPLQSLTNQFNEGFLSLQKYKISLALLIEKGANVLDLDKLGATFLHRLVLTNVNGVNNDEINHYLNKYKNLINAKTTQGLMPLQLLMNQFANGGCKEKDFEQTAKMLILHDADLDVKDSTQTRNTLLHWAMLNKQYDLAIEILKKNNRSVNAKNAHDQTPLQVLMSLIGKEGVDFNEIKKLAMLLVANGTNLNVADPARNKDILSQLLRVLISRNTANEYDADIEALLKIDSSIQMRGNKNEKNALQYLIGHFKSEKSTLDSLKKTAVILVKHGADPAPLFHLLIATNQKGVNNELITTLAETYSDVIDKADRDGLKPIQRVILTNDEDTLPNVEKLIELQCDASVKILGENLLEMACRLGNGSVAEFLTKKTNLTISKANVVNSFPKTQDERFWNWLLDDLHVDIQATNVFGESLLHHAAMQNNSVLAQWLIDKKINLNMLNENAESALNIAEENHYKKVSSLLLKSGAEVSNLNELFASIKCMREYGFKLKDKGESKGDVAVELADQLLKKASNLMRSGKVNWAIFKKDFTELLNSKNIEMSQYRIAWGTILMNIMIALTGVGAVLLGVRLAYTKSTTGRALFFNQKPKTTCEKHIEKIGRSLMRLTVAGV